MSPSACSVCGCTEVRGAGAHAIVAALAQDDLDSAIEAGLLESAPCDGCSGACAAVLVSARDSRLRALAARERYRARQSRLQRRAEERAVARAAPAASAATGNEPKPTLPSAAAAALERAKARAAERRKP